MCRKQVKLRVAEIFDTQVKKLPHEQQKELDERMAYRLNSFDSEKLKKAIQREFPDLRFRKTEGLFTLKDFAVKLENQMKKKEDFFELALGIIRKTAKHPEYTFESKLFKEFVPQSSDDQSASAIYCIKCRPVVQALATRLFAVPYYPSSIALEKAKDLREFIDLFYFKKTNC